MDDVKELDGSVVASSQHIIDDWITDRRMMPLLGIILDVHTADHKNNFSAQQTADLRGVRHECTILATDYLGKQPDILIPHVIITPARHSGIDNFDEDLPRGCSKMVDGSVYDTGLKNIDYAKLDGEWCMVGFVGGAFECPFILCWWPHPANRYDLATSGSGYKGKALVQYDPKKDRSRFLRRINGTYFAINKLGSVYLDTTESNSQVTIKDAKVKRELVSKGGHLQLDIEKSAQLEINFNEKEHKGPRLGAGSTKSAPVTDVDLPHPDQPVTGSPKARSTKRGYRRQKQWETFEKTSRYDLFCENTEAEGDSDKGKKGEALLKAEDTISITVAKGTDTGTMINIAKGKIQLWSDDGTQINVLNDEVQLVTKGGGSVVVKGQVVTVNGLVNVTGPLSVGGVGVPTILGTPFLADLGADYLAKELACATTTLAQWKALAVASTGPLVPLKVAFEAMATAWELYKNSIQAYMTKAILPPAANTYLAKNTTTT